MKHISSLLFILILAGCNLDTAAQAPAAASIDSPAPIFYSELGMGTTRVVTTEQVGTIAAGTRVRVSTASFSGTEWLYSVHVEGSTIYEEARESQLAWAPGEVPGAPSPTMRFDGDTRGLYPYITTDTIADIAAGTRVRIIETRWENNAWVYMIEAIDGYHTAEARESQLAPAPGITPGVQPTPAYYASDMGSGFRFITVEQVGELAPNTSVAISHVEMRRNEWIYTIITEDGRQAEAFGWQIDYAPDITPGFIPTPIFQGDIGMGTLRVVTVVTLGDIPAGTKVSLTSAAFDGREYIYSILTADGKTFDGVRESQLAYAPDVTPGAPTPTAEFGQWGWGYNMVTLQDVGDIRAGTSVSISTMSMQNGVWVYGIITQDGVYAEAFASQIRYVEGFTPGAPTPTAVFNSEFGMGVYRVITLERIGDIPAGTRVRVNSGYFNGIEWMYTIATREDVYFEARASQLAYAPGETPGAPTPTARGSG